ncbi:hypothetical protein MNBD_GAMMA12-107, partial [hydrothermal vent metagenome]
MRRYLSLIDKNAVLKNDKMKIAANRKTISEIFNTVTYSQEQQDHSHDSIRASVNQYQCATLILGVCLSLIK